MRRSVLGHKSRSGHYEEVDDSSAFYKYITLLEQVMKSGIMSFALISILVGN
jgi:hypothetical protein